MSTLLTVDWDTFIPEDPSWDIGHRESELFLNFLWQTRGWLLDVMKTTGDEAGFWDLIEQALDLSEVGEATVSDSHAYAWPQARQCNNIILVDAHHDLWEPQREDGVHCHDWGAQWMRSNPSGQFIWLYPEWGGPDMFGLPDEFKSRVLAAPLATAPAVLDKQIVDEVHICRSGCWTPPWLDHQFTSFCIASGLELSTNQDGAWHPLRPRWGEDELNNAKRMQAEMESFRSNQK